VSLPPFVRSFWYAAMELGQRCERTAWGAVATDDRFPLVWDANNAAVLVPNDGLDLEGIRSALLPALYQVGASAEHVEFWETSVENSALKEYRRRGERPDPDVAMVFDGPLSEPSPDVRVQEVTDPDPSFWPWYGDSLGEFGMELSEDVLDQMVSRTREVFLPAGMRWFVGSVAGEPAGYASLISLEGTGYLDNVVTMPGHRRRGVASATVTAAVAASVQAGDDHVFLLAERGGDPQRLYERLGFQVATLIESFTRVLAPEGAA
jgi:ribosomal protein S18 acetylase RimI-like enzyme